MTSREFLNVAHAALVEEFMRPLGGVGAPVRSLADALQLGAPWAEGFDWVPPEEDELTASGNAKSGKPRELTEAEIVEQNNRTLAWLERKMSNVKGGFGTT